MAKVDPRDFLLNTDYEMDKIIYFTELSQTVSSETTITIPHKLETVPLVFGIWSNNANFSNSHELNAQTEFSGNVTPCYVVSDSSDIRVTLSADQSTTFYVRIFGFEPNYKTSDGSINLSGKKFSTTSKYAKNFILNTGYNYLKLLKAGNFLEWDGDQYCFSYAHNLGYLPQVLQWGSEDLETYYSAPSFSYSDSGQYNYKDGLFVTDSEVITYSGMLSTKYDVRLYCDEA